MKVTRKTAILVIGFFALCGSAMSGPGTDPFSIALLLTEETVTSGSPVEVTITLTNTSNQKLEFAATYPFCDYSIQVNTLNSGPAGKTKHGKSIEGCDSKPNDVVTRSVLVALKPGEQWEDKVDLTQVYDLSQPGGYQIQASRRVPRFTGRPVQSNTMLLTVVPPSQ